MNPEELKQILELHLKWLNGKPGGQRADLSGANLAKADLVNKNLWGANFERADLYCADLAGANLGSANFERARLLGVNLTGANLTNANLDAVDAYCARLLGANLRGASLVYAHLTCTNLGEVNFTDADLTRAYLASSYLSGANFVCANLTNANLRSANLTNANFHHANLTGANLLVHTPDGKYIKDIPGLGWSIYYTHDTLQIGRERHPIEEWFSFSDSEIVNMHPGALDWWREHKEHIQRTIEQDPALAPGEEEANDT